MKHIIYMSSKLHMKLKRRNGQGELRKPLRLNIYLMKLWYRIFYTLSVYCLNNSLVDHCIGNLQEAANICTVYIITRSTEPVCHIHTGPVNVLHN